MMDPISSIAIPILTMFLMVVVGLELRPQDFLSFVRPPRKLFLLPAMAVGEILGRWVHLAPTARLAWVLELGFRNLELAIVVTATLLGQKGSLVFAMIFFLTANLYAIAIVALSRLRR